MFSGIRQNSLFYILEKGEELKLSIGAGRECKQSSAQV